MYAQRQYITSFSRRWKKPVTNFLWSCP